MYYSQLEIVTLKGLYVLLLISIYFVFKYLKSIFIIRKSSQKLYLNILQGNSFSFTKQLVCPYIKLTDTLKLKYAAQDIYYWIESKNILLGLNKNLFDIKFHSIESRNLLVVFCSDFRRIITMISNMWPISGFKSW